MATPIRHRPFTLLGYRFARGIYDERPAERDGQLFLVITPMAPIATDHIAQERRVVELSIILAIVHSANDGPVELKGEDAAFGPDTVLAVKCEAGYIAKDKEHDGDVNAFDVMLQHAAEQLYQMVRSKALSLAADSGFDATNIPAELDALQLFETTKANVSSAAREAPVKKRGSRAAKESGK